MSQVRETCSICGCEVHRSGDYAKPTVLGRSHATKHHFVAERFFGRSANRRGSKRRRLFPICPWGHESSTAVFCYECHEELLHNPVLLPNDVLTLAELVRQRGLGEDRKPAHRRKIAGRVSLLHDIISTGLKVLSHPVADIEEITTGDGAVIRRYQEYALDLSVYYAAYNRKYFENKLPNVPVHWASEIRLRNRHSANALFVSAEGATDRPPFIVVHEKLQGLEPLPRQCVMHEMVHVSLSLMGIFGHPEQFTDEFLRVLILDRLEVMGCGNESDM
jgi:hypothetical protein